MSTQPAGFTYGPSKKITAWNCHFDSLTELKYAISIVEDYEFIRERVVIFYDRSNREPTQYLRGSNGYYKPDFLIRHKITGQAFLVEIKPRAFQGHPQLDLRKELAEKYIRWKNYDWTYKVVFDDQIILNAEQLEDFKECIRLKSKAAYSRWFEQYNRKLGRIGPCHFTNASPEARIRYIMFGHSDQVGGWQR